MALRKSMSFKSLVWVFVNFAFFSPTTAIDHHKFSSSGLFESDEILDLRIEGDYKDLMKDRGDDNVYHPMKLSYFDDSGNTVSHDLRLRTRGNFRRQRSNCKKPPLTLNFEDHPPSETSLFAGETKLKLVVSCQNEKFVAREYLVYKLYNLVTEYSFKVRMVRITFHNPEEDKTTDSQIGFLIEDENKLAARTKAKLLKKDGFKPENLDKEAFHRMAVFAYMAGNTDWSIQFRHNIKLFYSESSKKIISVPYDFDLVGLVSAPYAKPASQLKMWSVKERRYRGYCLKDIAMLAPIFNQFRDLKEDFYKVYSDSDLIDEGYIKSMHKYLDDFYKVIDNPKKCKKEFLYPCDKNGTGNVVLIGLKKR